MAKNPRPIRKAARLAVRATKEEIKNPSVTRYGSPLQTKSNIAFAKTWQSDTNNLIGKSVQKVIAKQDAKEAKQDAKAARTAAKKTAPKAKKTTFKRGK